MSKAWQQQKERGSSRLIRFLAWIALTLGRRAIHLVLCFIIFYYVVFAKTARQASKQFMLRALKKKASYIDVYLHLLTFATVAIDRIYFLAGKNGQFDIHITGKELFEKYAGQGCILLTAHIGSFDVMRVLAAQQKQLKLRILLDIAHNSQALELIQALDPVLAQGVIDAKTPAPELALKLNEALANNEMVGIMADRCTQGDRRRTVEFLGEHAEFPEGPWQLAAVLKAPVIACFGVYRGNKRYDIHFEVIADQLGSSRKDRGPAIDKAIQHYVTRLEHFAQHYPRNWFNFYNFWGS